MKTIDTDNNLDARFSSLEIPGTPVSKPTTAKPKAVRTTATPAPVTVVVAEPAPAVNLSAYKGGGGLPAPKGRAKRNDDGSTKSALGHDSTPEHLHIARVWQDKCKAFPSIVASIDAAAPLKTDMMISAADMQFDADLRLKGMELTAHGIRQTAKLTGIPKPMIDYMVDHEDAKSLMPHLNRELAQMMPGTADKSKEKFYLARMIKDAPDGDNKIRAILSSSYSPINHTDAMEMLCKALPGGDCSGVLASHWNQTEELMSGNLFLPDRMKTMPDSDYGVGIAFRNSEVGKSSFQVLPFLFRAVCVNGMIWGRLNQEISVKQMHLGRIDLEALQADVNLAVETALSHGTNLLNAFQAIRDVEVEDPRRMIAMLSDRFGINRQQAQAWDVAYNVEPEGNAFGILNGLTRAAQGFDGTTQTALETVAGEMLAPSLEMDLRAVIGRWERFTVDAADVKEEQVVRLFAVR